MDSNREHPLYYLDAETLLVAIYIWVDDELKALQAQGFKLPRKQRHQKATLAELLTLAIFLLLQGQDLAKGYLAAKTTLKAYFPSLPQVVSRILWVKHGGRNGPRGAQEVDQGGDQAGRIPGRVVKAAIGQVLEEEMTEHLAAGYRERTPSRRGERNGHYTRDLITPAGRIAQLRVPRDGRGLS
jgi:hypothetical protein